MKDNQQPRPSLKKKYGESRACTKCGEAKPVSEFTKHNRYVRRSCKSCDRDEFRRKHKEWRDRNRDKLRSYQQAYKANMSDAQIAADKKYRREFARIRRAKLKEIVYAGYGGYRCACCGETEPDFLSIDHVNNDGYVRRKNGEARSTYTFYKMLIDRGFPDEFQVLCMNCNHGKARNGGVCPHNRLGKVQRPSLTGVGSSDPKRGALFVCEEVKIWCDPSSDGRQPLRVAASD